MSPLDDKSPEANVLRFLGRHLVALCVTFRERDKPDERPIFRAYAGTLIYIEGRNFFLTAGHILSELRDALQNARIEVLNAILGDTFGPTPMSKIPIPFVLKSEDMFFVDDDDAGLDFGVIMLTPYYVGLLAANGSVALTEENWVHQHKIRFDGYLILGLPVEYTSDRVNADGEGTVSATLIPTSTLGLVAAGLGIALVPESMQNMRMDGVVYRRLKGAQPKAFLGLASRRGDPSAIVRQFLNVVKKAAKQHASG